MKLQCSLLYLCAVLVTVLSQDKTGLLDPRGPRPSELGFKADTCATIKEWPICMDEDWGKKCPSGCRVQGLILQTDNEIHGKIRKINKLLDEGKKKHRSADEVSKNTYTYLREKLVTTAGSDNRYATLAEQLRQRIVELKIKIDRQLRMLEALKSQVKNQVVAMQRLEVDIDIKLRSCKGSCASYAPFSLDKESYATLDKQLERLDTLRAQSVETVSSLKVMKSRPMKDVVVPSIYKAGQAEQRRAFFPDVGQLQLSLEAEGSTAETAATVSKDSTVCESIGHQKRHYAYQRTPGHCPVQNLPMCTDDDEDRKCPQGCRLHGLIETVDEEIFERLQDICEKTSRYKADSSSTMLKSEQIYEAQRKIMVKTYMEEIRYAAVTERLHKNLTLLWKKSAELAGQLQRYHSQIMDQINTIRRTEVDIDIKLRACKGSCKQTFDHVIDWDSLGAAENELAMFDSAAAKQNPFALDKKLKLPPTRSPVFLKYRKIPAVQAADKVRGRRTEPGGDGRIPGGTIEHTGPAQNLFI